ncbi:MAG: hypothetical protein M3Q07_07685 [Pseudobdellovibrionaceae bacterium]|nr:hypothetical protein [Pseudobdellovibrionaceae bacterium]
MSVMTKFRPPAYPIGDGEDLIMGFDLARLAVLEYWYQDTCNLVWDSYGSNGSILALPDDEITYDYDQKVLDNVRFRLARCPSLEDAMDHMLMPNKEYLHGRSIDVAMSISCVWHELFYAEKLFRLKLFDWVTLAQTCCSIAEIAMAGRNVDDLIYRVNEIITFWNDF